MTEQPQPKPTVELVCLGACLLKGNKKGLRWCEVSKLDTAAESAFAFPRKLKAGPMSGAFTGAVVAVPMDGDTITFAHAKFVRSLASDPRVLPYALEHEAQVGRERSDAFFEAEKGKAFEKALRGMDPIRHAYKSTDHWGRLIIEARLLQYLRSPA